MNLRWGLNILFLLLLINASCEKSEKKHSAVIYGHAGVGIDKSRSVYPPNTDKAIDYALNVLDADGVEVDIRFTADSVAVVMHDSDVENMTNGVGCIEEMTLEQVKELEYQDSYHIIALKTVLTVAMKRNKYVFLDIKTNNECTGEGLNPEVLNRGLNEAVEGLSSEQKKLITVCSRDYSSVAAVEDSNLVRAFETEDFQVATNVYFWGEIDKLVFRYQILDNEKVKMLRANQIPFCIFDMKTQSHTRDGYVLTPDEMIVENIPFAKKIMR